MSSEKRAEVQWVVTGTLQRQTDYIIPDVLPTPTLFLIYGAGGDG